MSKLVYFSFEQFCETINLPGDRVQYIVELGILTPKGEQPDEWQFDADMLSTARRAQQLHRQLEVDWPGVALALQLLEQIDNLKSENQQLRQRLARFIDEL